MWIKNGFMNKTSWRAYSRLACRIALYIKDSIMESLDSGLWPSVYGCRGRYCNISGFTL